MALTEQTNFRFQGLRNQRNRNPNNPRHERKPPSPTPLPQSRPRCDPLLFHLNPPRLKLLPPPLPPPKPRLHPSTLTHISLTKRQSSTSGIARKSTLSKRATDGPLSSDYLPTPRPMVTSTGWLRVRPRGTTSFCGTRSIPI